MAWRRPGDKPLSEPMMVGLTTHICVTRPQRVKDSIFDMSQEPMSNLMPTVPQANCDTLSQGVSSSGVKFLMSLTLWPLGMG